MIVRSFVLRRLWPCVSPRVLCVASSLLYKCNDAINTFGCKQSLSQSINTHPSFTFPNTKVTGHIDQPIQGLLRFPRQCWNLTSNRSYGRTRFSPQHLTEAQIIDGLKSGKYHYDHVALCFSRKQLYTEKEFSPEFRDELGNLLVKHYSSLENIDPKVPKWVLNSLINLKYQTDPSFVGLSLRLIQNGCHNRTLYGEFIQQVGLLPLLNWKSIPPRADLISICQLIITMISEVEDRNLTYLLHTWVKDNRWRQIAREYLITDTYLKECQQRLPKIDIKHLTQLLEAISICLPLPDHVQLPPGMLEDIETRLFSPGFCQSAREAATLLDASFQIQVACCPSKQQVSIRVAKQMFTIWFNPKQKCVGRNQTLTCLVLRAMAEVGIDPGSLDGRYWPWFWKETARTVHEWRDDRQRLMVLDALYQLRITDAPITYVQKIINTIKANNPILAADLLYSLARIKEHLPTLYIHDRQRTKRSVKGYIDSMISNLSHVDIVVGAWSFGKLGISPTKVDSKFWIKFYEVLESCMTKLTSHQQNMLLTVLSQPSTELPTAEWLSMLLAAIDSRPADSASGAALILWNLMLLHRHLHDPTKKHRDLLDALTKNNEGRIMKFYNHWLKGMDGLNTPNEIIFPLDVINYFGLKSKVTQMHLDRWCKFMEKYNSSKWRAEDKKLFHEIVDAYKLSDCFRNKILKG